MMTRLGVLPEVAERCLNHVEENRMKRIYQRHTYETEMREAWCLLGDHLAHLTKDLPEDAIANPTQKNHRPREKALHLVRNKPVLHFRKDKSRPGKMPRPRRSSGRPSKATIWSSDPHIPRDAVSARQRIDYASCTLLCSTTAVLIDTLLDANSLKHLSKLWWLAGEHLPTPNQQLLHPKPSHLQAQGEV